MRLRLLAVLLAALLLAPVSAQAPVPPPPKGPLPPPPPVGVVPVLRPPLPLPLPPPPPVPPRLVTPITVQEYVVDYLVLTPPGRAIIASDYRLNRMRITTIRPVPLPPPLPPPPPVPVVPVPVVPVPPPKLLLKEKKDVFGAELRTIKVVKWTCGRLFEEADGRRWILVHGTPISEKPPELAGWVMPTESGVPSFMTRSGRLFHLAPGSK